MLKGASLERQLETETQSKQTAEKKSTELQLKISELEKRLETQTEPSEDKIAELEKQLMDLQLRLQTEAEQRRTAEENICSLELKVSELEKPSEALACIDCKQVHLSFKWYLTLDCKCFICSCLFELLICLMCADEERSGGGYSIL